MKTMRSNTVKGKEAEKVAEMYLREKGYEILETNWRFGHKEIDIIAITGNEIVFVEVKSRHNEAFGLPEEAVTPAKEKLLIEAAEAYLDQKDMDLEARFDVITLLNGKVANHFERAL